MAHVNSTGVNVPIFLNADPAKMPSIGMSMPYQSGSDAAIQEGVFFGNIVTHNPPDAYYAKGNGFKASIAGRLGASSSMPYKPFEGYRSDSSQLYSGVAHPLCRQILMSDAEHADFKSCQAGDVAYGSATRSWGNVITTYVNANYNSATVQNFSAKTINFEADTIANKTNTPADIWTTAISNFEFSNTVGLYTTGLLKVASVASSKRLCATGANEGIVLTKNTGEPFSLVSLSHVRQFAGSSTFRVKGFKKGSSTLAQMTGTSGTAASTMNFAGWDNLLKVEIKIDGCIDEVKLKS